MGVVPVLEVAAADFSLAAAGEVGTVPVTFDEPVFSAEGISTPDEAATACFEDWADPAAGAALTEMPGAIAIGDAEREDSSPADALNAGTAAGTACDEPVADETATGEAALAKFEWLELVIAVAAVAAFSLFAAGIALALFVLASPLSGAEVPIWFWDVDALVGRAPPESTLFVVGGGALSAVVTFSHHFPGIFTIVSPVFLAPASSLN